MELRTEKARVIIQKQPWQLKISCGADRLVFSTLTGECGYQLASGDKRQLRFAADMHPEEHFYGFGEKFNGLDQRGNRVVMEIDDAYMSENERTYKSIPFFISSAKYGLLINSGMGIVFHLGDQSEKFYSFEIPDSEIDFYIFTNENPLKIIEQCTAITGRPPVIPKWSLEPWLSRRRMTGWDNTAVAEADVDMILNNGFRLGVILWEGIRGQFGKNQNPSMYQLSDKWHSLGIKQVFWSRAGHIPTNSPEFKESNSEYFIRNSDSTFCIGGFKGSYAYIDPTNPAAMKWWKKTFYEPFLTSVENRSSPNHCNLDGIKIDFCELFPKNDDALLMYRPIKGIANLHAVLFSEQIYDWLQEIKPAGGITWVRGGGLGLQRVGYVWGGDRGRTFSQFKRTVSASLSVSLCGVALIGHDLGGYRGGDSPEAREVYIRGAQYAAFSPSFHDHGSAPAPWEQDEYGRENYEFYARVRYNLLPYLYHYVHVAHQTGLPLMRTLFLHYPDDENTYLIDDEYMLGDALLVAPFVHPGAKRNIYLPGDRWIDFWTGIEHAGGQTISYRAPLNRIPVFVKKNSIIPLELSDALEIGGPFPQSQKNDLLLTFFVVGMDKSNFAFRDDDGQVHIASHLSDSELTVTVENINRNFAICAFGKKPRSVTVNQAVLPRRNIQAFEKSKAGWAFAENAKLVLIKISHEKGCKSYRVQINNTGENFALSCELAGSPPPTPEITKVEGWDQSLDVYFERVDDAQSYMAKFGPSSEGPVNTVENVTESPFTIRDLKNDVSYVVSIAAVNEWGKSKDVATVTGRPEAGRKPIFNISEEPAFVRANHYITKDTTAENKYRIIFAVYPQVAGVYGLWIKAKKNEPHHRYFRWYEQGDIQLEPGTNFLNVIVADKRIDVDKLFITLNNKRPLLVDEVETSWFEKMDTSTVNRIIVEFQ